MTYRLLIAYIGTNYAGWQRQENALAVQQALEEALLAVLGQRFRVFGAGRTDAGVHARGQVAHLTVPAGAAPDDLPRTLSLGVNHHLPPDIRVLRAVEDRNDFHARKSAAAKTYSYRLCRARVIDPFRAPFVIPAPRDLDVDRLENAARLIAGRRDFSAFAKAGGSHRQPIRRVYRAEWTEVCDELRFLITGDGFLRGMVRALVGTTLDVGRGRRSLADFEALLRGMPRTAAGPNAPARGLCLETVHYDRREQNE